MLKKTLFIAIISVLLLGTSAYAAPYFRQEAGLVPITDSTYYLGTTTPVAKAWKSVVTDELCLTADTCYTSITSSGSSFGQAWELYGSGTYLAPTTTKGIIVSASSTISALTVTNGTTTNATSTDLYVSGSTRLASLSGLLKASSGVVTTAVAGTDYQTFAYPFGVATNATTTLTNFNGGLTSYASTTIGSGTQTGGLTISGGATTTGNSYIDGNVCIGTTNCSGADLTISSAASFQAPISNATIHVVGSNNMPVRAVFDTNNAASQFGTLIQGRRSRGPAASPSAVTGGDVLLQLAGAGYGSTGYVSSNGSKGIIAIKSDGTWTDTSSPTRMEFFTVPGLSVTNNLQFTIASSGAWGIGGTASQVISDADFGDAEEIFVSNGMSNRPKWTSNLTISNSTTTNATTTSSYISTALMVASTTSASTFTVQGSAYVSGNVFLGATTSATTSEQYLGRISPWRYLSLSTATTSTWTASTSGAYIPFVTAPFTGTIRDVSCTASSTGAFIGVAPYIGTTPTTPSYFVASSTVGRVTFTSNNTFTVGQSIGAVFGTTTTDSNAKNVSCTFRVTETP